MPKITCPLIQQKTINPLPQKRTKKKKEEEEEEYDGDDNVRNK